MEKESGSVRMARQRIDKAINQDGAFSHNMIGLALAILSREDGQEAADKLVDEYNLTELYEIQKVGKKAEIG